MKSMSRRSLKKKNNNTHCRNVRMKCHPPHSLVGGSLRSVTELKWLMWSLGWVFKFHALSPRAFDSLLTIVCLLYSARNWVRQQELVNDQPNHSSCKMNIIPWRGKMRSHSPKDERSRNHFPGIDSQEIIVWDDKGIRTRINWSIWFMIRALHFFFQWEINGLSPMKFCNQWQFLNITKLMDNHPGYSIPEDLSVGIIKYLLLV